MANGSGPNEEESANRKGLPENASKIEKSGKNLPGASAFANAGAYESAAISKTLVPSGDEYVREMFAVIPDGDAAREYVQSIASKPDRTAELEQSLLKEPERNPARAASDALVHDLVESNLRLSPWLARNFAERGPTFMELIDAGNLGLKQAAEKFDRERGYQFALYAMWFVRQNMTREVAKHGRRLEGGTHVEIQQVREHDDRTVFDDGSSKRSSDAELSRAFLKQCVIQMLGELPARERDVMRLRFGLEDGQERTIEEIAALYGMTPERVRQLESRALRKIKPTHRQRKHASASKRAPVKRIGRGQFRAVLAALPEDEAEIMRFKWGFFDGQIRSLAETAERFSKTLDEIEKLEAKALDMVSDL
ncbi:MAG TPA: sigma-70 family RNA polymerase sigma factor [Oculatellaceae cyanobacterium]